MGQLTSAEAAITRFKENENRVDIFANDPNNVGFYQTNEATPRQVESLPHFMARMISRYLILNSKGNWQTATAYVQNDLVKQGGVVYIALSDHTSGTFATDLAADKWAVYSINDASLLDYTASGSSTPRSVYSELEDMYVNIKRYGGYPGAPAAVNDTALTNARNVSKATGRRIYIPSGTWKFGACSVDTGDLLITGEGDSTILDFTGTITGGYYALDTSGTATQIQDLGATALAGSMTIQFNAAPSLSVGDVFVIFNPADYSWSQFRANYYAGEWCEVESISGNIVTLKNPLYDTYTAASVDIYKIASPRVELKNFKVLGTTILGLIKPSLCISPLLENISGEHQNNVVVYFDRCFKPVYKNPKIRNIGSGGDDYGIVVGSSQHSRIYGGDVYSRRHAIAHGGGAEVCSTPVRDSKIYEALLKNDINSGTEAADFHGNSEDCAYVDCMIYNGANLQGKDNYYRGCTITNTLTGYCVYHAEVKGGRLGMIDCEFITNKSPHTASRAIYDIGGNNDAVTEKTVLDVTFYVENCKVNGRNMDALTTFMRFRNAGATVKTNFEINGLIANVNAMGQILLTGSSSGTPNSDFIIVDNVSGFPAGTYLHNPSANAYTNFPHRMQRQGGKVELTATSGTSYAESSSISFKYPYPREPLAFATKSTLTSHLYNGNRCIWGGVSQVTNAAIKCHIESGDATAWSSTKTVNVSWAVELAEC